MLLILIRAAFVLVIAGLAVRMAKIVGENDLANPYLIFIALMLGAIAIVAGDLLTPRKRIQTISALYFGVIVGIFLSNLITDATQPAMQLYLNPKVHMALSSVFSIFMCYICVSTLAPDQGRFPLHHPLRRILEGGEGSPPARARHLGRDRRPDRRRRRDPGASTSPWSSRGSCSRSCRASPTAPTSSGATAAGAASTSSTGSRNRPGIEVRIHDAEIPELAGIREVDQRLVILAKHLGGKVVTNDYNLNKIARLQGVEVINLNDLANAMKPIVLPGEYLTVKLIKRGEEQGQGVGYLDDGTMVVAEQGSYHLGETVRLDRHQRAPDQRRADDLRPDRIDPRRQGRERGGLSGQPRKPRPRCPEGRTTCRPPPHRLPGRPRPHLPETVQPRGASAPSSSCPSRPSYRDLHQWQTRTAPHSGQSTDDIGLGERLVELRTRRTIRRPAGLADQGAIAVRAVDHDTLPLEQELTLTTNGSPMTALGHRGCPSRDTSRCQSIVISGRLVPGGGSGRSGGPPGGAGGRSRRGRGGGSPRRSRRTRGPG